MLISKSNDDPKGTLIQTTGLIGLSQKLNIVAQFQYQHHVDGCDKIYSKRYTTIMFFLIQYKEIYHYDKDFKYIRKSNQPWL